MTHPKWLRALLGEPRPRGIAPQREPRAWFTSADEVRRYVDDQLAEAVKGQPTLTVRYLGTTRDLGIDGAPLVDSLCWIISSSEMDPSRLLISRGYLVEARLRDTEFVIWFGKLGWLMNFPSIRDQLAPAVHVSLSSLEVDSVGPEHRYSLADVLRFMLEHQTSARTSWDPVVYPLNGHRY